MEKISLTKEQLIERARKLIGSERKIIGITGAPGAGKSTIANLIVSGLGERSSVLVPMDGFHLANTVLEKSGKLSRKGAIDTFDGEGYLNLLRRLRAQDEEVVYAPDYYRTFEESIGSAIPVSASIPLVITEGNYLLFRENPWGQVRELLDEVWFIDLDQNVRIDRLIKRHIEVGKSEEDAKFWSTGSDEVNAQSILALKESADLVIEIIE